MLRELFLIVACVSAVFAGPASSPTLGGKHDADPKDPKFQELVQWTESFIDGQTNSLYSMKLFDIISATRQVVAGVNYQLKLELAHTECPKSLGKKKDQCEFDHSLPHVVCEVKIFDQPWTKTRRVDEFKCSDSVAAVGPTGQEKPVEPFMKKFQKFERKFGKIYTPEERLKRFEIFKENMAKIAELQKHEQGTAKYGITRFADMSEEEFKKNYLGYRPDLKKPEATLEKAEIPEIEIPESFDWRDHGAVTPVKNQGQCGSCWAFSVTGNVEGQWAIKQGKLLELSEQELVDCDKLDEGCNGGLMENAYKSIVNLGGLETEAEYPYDAHKETCKFNKTEVRAVITGGVELPKNETAMAQWLAKNGPISIAINANAMQFYFNGVSHPWKVLCNPGGLDHGVLIVGYGVHRTRFTKRDVPYWIVKNSWGPGWGEKGYYLVYRGDGTCGVDQAASSATIA